MTSTASAASALLVGGASGLGAATARRLADRGLHVVIADRDADAGRRLASDLPDALFVEADVTDASSLDHAAATAAGIGPLRVVLSCAGVAPRPRRLVSRRGEPMGLEDWQPLIDIHLTGTFNTITTAGHHMAQNKPNVDGERGVIVTTSSAARTGMQGAAAYSAAKAGIVALTSTAALDLAPLGIRCVSIAPGTFDTPMLDQVNDQSTSLRGKVNAFPDRRGRPEEFAGMVEHIWDNGFLNGACLPLDGAIFGT
ncbi:MAG: NAD(P)-dependent dehydrogenase (short-subunit alcohol dehydrogenase family) [Acidimicrobiales bacterium]|jgi:NAD(P)-dependent dehydrogenase (short-subunit alcohol dehydrogenase family)